MKREFPDHPIVGVGGVVIHRNRVLLIRRGGEPLKGEWSIPGGMLELGEELAAGVRRELKEETGLDVEPLQVIATFDRIVLQEPPPRARRPVAGRLRPGEPRASGDDARVRYHYVIIDYVCRWKAARLRPASDVLEACWVRREDLPQYQLTEKATSVILEAFQFFEKRK